MPTFSFCLSICLSGCLSDFFGENPVFFGDNWWVYSSEVIKKGVWVLRLHDGTAIQADTDLEGRSFLLLPCLQQLYVVAAACTRFLRFIRCACIEVDRIVFFVFTLVDANMLRHDASPCLQSRMQVKTQSEEGEFNDGVIQDSVWCPGGIITGHRC